MRRRWSSKLAQVCLLLGIMLIPVAALTECKRRKANDFLDRAERGVGVVVARDMEWDGRGKLPRDQYWIGYQYDVAGRRHADRVEVPSRCFETARVGAEIELWYAPGQPSVSRLVCEGGADSPALVAGFAIGAVVLLGIGLAVIWWRRRAADPPSLAVY